MRRNKKREMGLRMQTKVERNMKGLFDSYRFSKAWFMRKQAIKERVAKQGKPQVKKTSTWVSKRSIKRQAKTIK